MIKDVISIGAGFGWVVQKKVTETIDEELTKF